MVERPTTEKISTEIEKAYNQIVKKDLQLLGIDGDPIFESIQIRYKLAEMAYNPQVADKDQFKKTHFKESIQIAESIKAIFENIFEQMSDAEFDELNKKLKLTQSKKNLLKAAVLHDIGKTGAEENTFFMQDNIIMWLYNYKYGEVINADIKIGDLLEREKGGIKQLYIDQLKNYNLTTENSMRDLYDRHSLVTIDILAREFGKEESEEFTELTDQGNMIAIAGKHHNTNNIDYGGTITNDSLLIEIIDKITAFYHRRGTKGKDIDAAINFITDTINNTKNEKLKKEFFIVFDFVKQHIDLIK